MLENFMDKISTAKANRWTFLLISIGLWLAVSSRWVLEFVETEHRLTFPLSIMLLVYGILMVVEFLLPQENRLRTNIYLAVQTALVFIATLFHYELDYFALLYVPLTGQATLSFPRANARLWAGILIVMTVIGELIQFGSPGAFSFTFLYVAAIIFVTLFSEQTLQSERARKRSDALLAELQEAHQQLQEFTDQAQELAVAQERNRLARELHDSVAQTLYGLTLRSEAALRNLKQGDTESVAAYLQEFQESTQQSLRETRLLIFDLRPDILKDEGLRAALISRLDFVEKRSGLSVEMDIDEVQDIPRNVEVAFYLIAQEALNNVLKHAQASKVQVILKSTSQSLQMIIQDNGIGFQGEPLPQRGGLGFQSMQERAVEIGAKLEIDPVADKGVRVFIEVAL
jgi:signal transduction histidine kinase